MSVTEEAAAKTAAPAPAIADPAPLGLAAFALTTFLLSAKNAGWMSHSSGLTFWGYAFGYGGLVQLLAGMWEFRNKNVFGATAFASYGGFWIGVGLYVQLVAGGLLGSGKPEDVALYNHDLGWILLAFFIFNTYMLIMSTQLSMAVFGVFLTLGLTEILGAIAQFTAGSHVDPTGFVKVSGYVGILTAAVAWYTSAAGVANGMGLRLSLPVGKPLIS